MERGREAERKRAGGEELDGCLAPRQHIPQLPHTDVRSGLVFGSRFGPRLAVIGGVWGRVRPNEVSGSLVRGEQQPAMGGVVWSWKVVESESVLLYCSYSYY